MYVRAAIQPSLEQYICIGSALNRWNALSLFLKRTLYHWIHIFGIFIRNTIQFTLIVSSLSWHLHPLKNGKSIGNVKVNAGPDNDSQKKNWRIGLTHSSFTKLTNIINSLNAELIVLVQEDQIETTKTVAFKSVKKLYSTFCCLGETNCLCSRLNYFNTSGRNTAAFINFSAAFRILHTIIEWKQEPW